MVELPKSLLKTRGSHQGRVLLLVNGASQIVVEILVCPIGGENSMLKALIDIGAQINVVRSGLFSENDMRLAKHPSD